MGNYGTRSGKFIVKKLTVKDKIPVNYGLSDMVAFSTAALIDSWNVHTATTAYHPHDLKVRLPYPMPLLVYTAATGSAGHTDRLLVDGYDAAGKHVSEYVYIKGTALGTNCSSNAYSRIVTLKPSNSGRSGMAPKTTDINVSWRSTYLGLPFPLASTADIISYNVGSTGATTASFTLDKTYNTLKDAGYGAGKSMKILYLSKLQ